MHQLNWDNLRFVLAVANQGSIAAAARELGVNRSTVLRRIAAFQENLNCRIFEQTATGYALTPQAERMIDAARDVENTLFDMQREIVGSELRLAGELRVTTTDSLMVSIFGPVLASFQRLHPEIVVDVLITNNVLDLNRRDADVAVRPTNVIDRGLVGHKIRALPFGLFASHDYAESVAGCDWRDYRWVGVESAVRATALGKWLDTTVPDDRVCSRSDSFVAIRVVLENGLGVGVLPRFLGESSPHLRLVEGPSVEVLTTGLWAITHEGLVRSARVSAFVDHVKAALSDGSVSHSKRGR